MRTTKKITTTKKKSAVKVNTLSEFFLYAPLEKKIAVFKRVAQRANEDQRAVMKKARAGLKAS